MNNNRSTRVVQVEMITHLCSSIKVHIRFKQTDFVFYIVQVHHRYTNLQV